MFDNISEPMLAGLSVNGQRALALAAEGVPVFPCRDDPMKRKGIHKTPLTPHGFKNATTDVATITGWWANYPDALIGMPTGAASGIDVLDIDSGKDDTDGDSARAYLAEHSDLPGGTFAYRTQSGGMHICYRALPGAPNDTNIIVPGVDGRAAGGYVVRWDQHDCPVVNFAPIAAWPAHVLKDIALVDRSSWANGAVDPERRRPPSAQAVVDLLRRLPNTLSTTRNDYAAIMQAAAHCAEVTGDPDGTIKEAACAWAEKYPAWKGDDERAKWDDDWTRHANTAGWQSLDRVACKLIPGYAAAKGEAHAAEAVKDFDHDPLPASGTYWHGQRPYGDRKWRFNKLLPERAVAILSGQWGTGKTFIGVEIAVCAMLGIPFLGHAISEPCGALWLAAEGETELPDRLHAAALKHGSEGSLPFAWRDQFPRLLDAQAAATIIGYIRSVAQGMRDRGAKLGVVIIDTLGLSAGWENENDSAEANRVMGVLKEISKATGVLVIAIDHYGKNEGSGTRGSSAKEANADVVLSCLGERADSGQVKDRRLAVRKVRGGPSGMSYPFDLPVTVLGQDADGNDVDTCAVKWLAKDTPARVASTPTLKPSRAKWLDVYDRHAGPGGISRGDWWDAGQREGTVGGSDSTFRGAINDALKLGLLEQLPDGSYRRPESDLGSLIDGSRLPSEGRPAMLN